MAYYICSMSVVFHTEWWQSSKWNKTNNLPGKNGAQERILCTHLAHLAFTPIVSALLSPTAKMLDLGSWNALHIDYFQLLPTNSQNPAPHQHIHEHQLFININTLASFACKLIPYGQNWVGSPSECFSVKWEAFLKEDLEKLTRYFT